MRRPLSLKMVAAAASSCGQVQRIREVRRHATRKSIGIIIQASSASNRFVLLSALEQSAEFTQFLLRVPLRFTAAPFRLSKSLRNI